MKLVKWARILRLLDETLAVLSLELKACHCRDLIHRPPQTPGDLPYSPGQPASPGGQFLAIPLNMKFYATLFLCLKLFCSLKNVDFRVYSLLVLLRTIIAGFKTTITHLTIDFYFPSISGCSLTERVFILRICLVVLSQLPGIIID